MFLKNLYIRVISDDDPNVLTMDADTVSFTYFIQERKIAFIKEINNRLKSINEIIEEANNLMISYLSTVLQYIALILAFIALFNINDLMPIVKGIGTCIGELLIKINSYLKN